jgi:hypothetical protein
VRGLNARDERFRRLAGRRSLGVGVVKSLELTGAGPVVLVHTQNFGIELEKPTCVSCLTMRARQVAGWLPTEAAWPNPAPSTAQS